MFVKDLSLSGYLEVGGEEIEGLCLREAWADFDDGELAGDDVHNARVLQPQRIEMHTKETSSTLTHRYKITCFLLTGTQTQPRHLLAFPS
jgi:hypothetical protein